jgi:hypothetical protein
MIWHNSKTDYFDRMFMVYAILATNLGLEYISNSIFMYFAFSHRGIPIMTSNLKGTSKGNLAEEGFIFSANIFFFKCYTTIN